MFLARTIDGYDVGGTAPLCIRSQLEVPAAAVVATTQSSQSSGVSFLQQKQQQIIDEALAEAVQNSYNSNSNGTTLGRCELLPTCPLPWNDELTFTPLFENIQQEWSDEEQSSHLLLQISQEKHYPFQINFVGLDDDNVLLYARFFFCDSTWPLSACHPLVDVLDDDGNYYHYHDDDGDNTTSTNAPSLLAAARSTPHLITTPWLAMNNNNDTLLSSPTNVTIQLHDNVTAGLYHLLLHVKATITNKTEQDNDDDDSSVLIQRLDVALLDSNHQHPVVQIQAPPRIQRVTDDAKGIIFFVSICCGVYAAFCLVVCWRRRHDNVMKLAQSPLIILLAAAALVVFAHLFVVLPTADWHCRALPLMGQVPVLLVTVILNARLWRVYQTLSVAGNLGRRGKSTRSKHTHDKDDEDSSSGCSWRRCLRYCCCCCSCCRKLRLGEKLVGLYSWLSTLPFYVLPEIAAERGAARRRSDFRGRRSLSSSHHVGARGPTLRKAVTTAETMSLIVMLMLPPLIVGIVGTFVQEARVTLEMDYAANVGRYMCGGDGWSVFMIDVYTGCMEFFSLVLAWISRNLPSAFNEKNQLFLVSGLTLVINIVSYAVAGDVEEPTASPDSWVRCHTSARVLSLRLPYTYLLLCSDAHMPPPFLRCRWGL